MGCIQEMAALNPMSPSIGSTELGQKVKTGACPNSHRDRNHLRYLNSSQLLPRDGRVRALGCVKSTRLVDHPSLLYRPPRLLSDTHCTMVASVRPSVRGVRMHAK